MTQSPPEGMLPVEQSDIDGAIAVCRITGWLGVAARFEELRHKSWWKPDLETGEGKLLALFRDCRIAAEARTRDAEDRVRELEAEVQRLRNIMNEDGLIDDDLAKVAGEPMSVLRAATSGKSTFDPNRAALSPKAGS